MTTWHVAAADLRDYAAGTAGVAVAASVESHVPRCRDCAAALSPAVDAGRLDAVWAEIGDRIDLPRRSLLERALAAVGVRDTDARLLAATPNLRSGWFGSLTLVAAFAFLATVLGAGRGDITLLLLLAPVLPVIGVAAAFGPHADPTYDLTVAAPYSVLRLLLLRAATVLGTCVTVTAAIAFAMPDAAATTAWLLPALALTLATLALATWLDIAVAATAVAVGWAVVVGELARRDEMTDLNGGAARLGCVLLAVLAAAVLVQRRRHFDQEGSR
ncbi:MAG TPA: hypothetical protein VNA20_08480 [Frankiaceae bacterium]|nr:hypothetical protein [Frankiaceae bacterium]